MVIDSVDTLLSLLRRLQLLGPQQVDEIARELAPHYADPFELSGYLIEIDWLTAYQRRLLFEGRWNELAVGPYQILDRLGESGVSEVYKAWDTVRGRDVALKVLRQHLAIRADAVQLLQRELQAVIRLDHPNIIKTYDADRVEGLPYFAMEYVEGLDLHQYVQRCGPLPVEQACDYVRQTAQGLQHAHQSGLVHRDVKPANLFLLNPPLPDGEGKPRLRPAEPVVKILDWGLARLKPTAGEEAAAVPHDLDAEKGLLIGTADYIAPEQAQDPTLVDIRADIYSLGLRLLLPAHGSAAVRGAVADAKAVAAPGGAAAVGAGLAAGRERRVERRAAADDGQAAGAALSDPAAGGGGLATLL